MILLARLKASPYYSIMADESMDTSSKEELSVCARWIEGGKAILHAQKVTARALTQARNVPIQKLCGLGFDGASTMFGVRSGVQMRMRYHSLRSLPLPPTTVSSCQCS
jgi:hypothetical protein